MNTENYKRVENYVHVYKKPSLYIGDINKKSKNTWLYSFFDNTFYEDTIHISEGVERLFTELLTNVTDNCKRSQRFNVDPGIIQIKMNNEEISVYNEGLPIPIEKNENGVYIPEIIFGNYIDEHLGVKIVNIFSKFFKIIIHDHIRKLKYSQVWKNNMHDKEDPQLENYEGITSSLEVVYHLDFEKFNYDPIQKIDGTLYGGYTNDVFSLFARHCAALSVSCKMLVNFNNILFSIDTIEPKLLDINDFKLY